MKRIMVKEAEYTISKGIRKREKDEKAVYRFLFVF